MVPAHLPETPNNERHMTAKNPIINMALIQNYIGKVFKDPRVMLIKVASEDGGVKYIRSADK